MARHDFQHKKEEARLLWKKFVMRSEKGLPIGAGMGRVRAWKKSGAMKPFVARSAICQAVSSSEGAGQGARFHEAGGAHWRVGRSAAECGIPGGGKEFERIHPWRISSLIPRR